MRRSEAELEVGARMIHDLRVTLAVIASTHDQVARIVRQAGARATLVFVHPGASVRELARCRAASSAQVTPAQHVAPQGTRSRAHYMNLAIRAARTPWVLITEERAEIPVEWLAQIRIALHRWPQAFQAELSATPGLLGLLLNRRLVFEMGWFDEQMLAPPYDLEDWRLRMSSWIGVDIDKVLRDRYCDIPAPVCTIPILQSTAAAPCSTVQQAALCDAAEKLFWAKWKVDHAAFAVSRLHKSGRPVRVRATRVTEDYFPLDRQGYGDLQHGR